MGPSNVSERGREASRPHQLPRRAWGDILWRVFNQIGRDNLGIVAAGLAFYALLALFPGLTALVAIYGWIAEPAAIQAQLAEIAILMPPEARPLLLDQVDSLSGQSESTLSLAVLGGLAIALLSSMRGMKALIIAMNIAYGEEERRSILKLNLLAFVLNVGAIMFFTVSLAFVAAVPAVLAFAPLPEWMQTTISLVRWPILVVLVMVGLGILYHFAPRRSAARWHWVSWGAGAATALWIAASVLFSIYVENFGNYNKMYGSLGALVILLLWLFVSAYAVLLGAELNAEMEHQTRHDTTVGVSRPMGERNAHVADTVGKARR